MYALGIDIGGTKTAIAIMNVSGTIISHDQLKTSTHVAPEVMLDRIIICAKKLLEKSDVTEKTLLGIGIGAPGPLDLFRGMITYPPNLPLWREVRIVDYISQHFSVPIHLENDASAAALAEHHFGAGHGHKNILFVTISTGIGAGIIANNTLISGGIGNAGDVGHMVVDPSFGLCVCGQLGCFEHICSGTAISREASRLKKMPLSTKDVFQLYREKEPVITPYLDKVIERMGMAFVSLINTLDPEIVIIGGGVSQAGDILFEPIRHYVTRFTLNKDAAHTPIVPAELNQTAGVIGAAALILNR